MQPVQHRNPDSLEDLRGFHDESDFEPECPTCWAFKKLQAAHDSIAERSAAPTGADTERHGSNELTSDSSPVSQNPEDLASVPSEEVSAARYADLAEACGLLNLTSLRTLSGLELGQRLGRFTNGVAERAAASERERCAVLCETLDHGAFGSPTYRAGIADGSRGCAAAIRQGASA